MMRMYVIKRDGASSERMSLSKLNQETDISPNELNSIVDLAVGDAVNLDDMQIVRVQ